MSIDRFADELPGGEARPRERTRKPPSEEKRQRDIQRKRDKRAAERAAKATATLPQSSAISAADLDMIARGTPVFLDDAPPVISEPDEPEDAVGFDRITLEGPVADRLGLSGGWTVEDNERRVFVPGDMVDLGQQYPQVTLMGAAGSDRLAAGSDRLVVYDEVQGNGQDIWAEPGDGGIANGTDSGMGALARVEPTEIVARWSFTPDRDLYLPEDMSLDEWRACGQSLKAIEDHLQWWIGKWWSYGERRYGDYANQEAKDWLKSSTGFTYSSVTTYASVYRALGEDFLRRLQKGTALTFSDYQEVAPLARKDPARATQILDQIEAAPDQFPGRVIRKLVRSEVRKIDQKPTPGLQIPDELPVLLEVSDARKLQLYDEAVDLIVTSPPYGLDKDYGGEGDIDPYEWAKFMNAWLFEAFRVAKNGGRLALNVPLDTTLGGFTPNYARAINAAINAGWTYRSTIVWADETINKSVARGSVDSPSAPHVIAPVEMIALFSKGDWKRTGDADKVDILHEQWLEWTNGLWKIPGESRAWEGHPAAFPETIPSRLIKLLSYRGDTVLDPFCGSGTTVVAAYKLGREAIGFDASEQYVESAKRRIVRAMKERKW